MTNILLFFAAAFTFANEPCHIKRHALYDVGSGSTKMAVIETNSCEKTPQTLLTGYEKVDYKDDLLKSGSFEFSETVQQAGMEALKRLKAEATKLTPDEHRGIATAAFREAKNAPQLVGKFKSQLEISIDIISQEQEGRLAYLAVKQHEPEESLLVWDIGGASFQLTAFDEKSKEWSVFKGTMASVVFKDVILEKIKKKPGLATPNPLSHDEIRKARRLLVKELSGDFKKSFVMQSRFKKVVGIGGVLALSQKKNLQKSVFTLQDIENWLGKNHKKTDAELNDKYAATVVTNMILVSEMMKIMKIKSVEALDVALVEGLLAPVHQSQ